MPRQSKVSQPTKPVKPRKGFPLYAHASGRWAKKVRGGIRYFGTCGDPQTALHTWLDLTGTAITDAGRVHLAVLGRLDSLCLSDTAITDAGLVRLANMRRLKWLGLSGTKVTDAAVKRFQQTLPKCQIIR